ncbi:hypothetical protein [Rhizomicrobium electricum]|uniref:Outer membrane protein beta-barrel domain-containing protein n=1 Tax=Rhizomicrobium electricum TaxID=480070 RepID=A0ABP3Q2N4_9PROT|nr:hypothetical protein [Rhizomicrobium electricum]NIJ49321.1 hypothetical protein [Rhizomicrobium electricum]
MKSTASRPGLTALWRILIGAGLGIFAAAAPALAQSEPPAWWKTCQAIRDDRARLACFDVSVPADQPATDRPLRTPPRTGATPAVATQTAAPAEHRKHPVSYRASIGYGLGIGSHGGNFIVNHGALTSTAGIGSDGDAGTVQFWIDHWIGRDWSIGLEYLYLNSEGKLILDLPKGAEVLTDPINAHTTINAHGHLGFVNVAYRPGTKAILQPYIGTGLGVGWGSVNADLGASNAFVGSYTYTQRSSTMFGALQGFMGIDVSMGPNYYGSTFAKAVWMPGRPFFKLHQRYLEFVLGGGIGRKF